MQNIQKQKSIINQLMGIWTAAWGHYKVWILISFSWKTEAENESNYAHRRHRLIMSSMYQRRASSFKGVDHQYEEKSDAWESNKNFVGFENPYWLQQQDQIIPPPPY